MIWIIVGILTGYCYIKSRTFLQKRGTNEFCMLYEEEDEIDTAEFKNL